MKTKDGFERERAGKFSDKMRKARKDPEKYGSYLGLTVKSKKTFIEILKRIKKRMKK